jgi:GT2 family glycosyltransferase
MQEFNYTDEPIEVAYIFGADMMLPKTLFDEVGGFDPDFFMYGEEEELTWRITQRNRRVICVPQAKIIHLEGATVKKQNEFSTRQFKMRMNGALTYYKKRFGPAGADEFYRLRGLCYDRLIKIAKIIGKYRPDMGAVLQRECLDQVYRDFIKGDS